MKITTIGRFTATLFISLLFPILFQHGLMAAENAPASPDGLHIDPVGTGPFYYDTAEGIDIRVRVIARGLIHPWSITWLPDGSALVTEKNVGRVRRIINDN